MNMYKPNLKNIAYFNSPFSVILCYLLSDLKCSNIVGKAMLSHNINKQMEKGPRIQ